MNRGQDRLPLGVRKRKGDERGREGTHRVPLAGVGDGEGRCSAGWGGVGGEGRGGD